MNSMDTRLPVGVCRHCKKPLYNATDMPLNFYYHSRMPRASPHEFDFYLQRECGIEIYLADGVQIRTFATPLLEKRADGTSQLAEFFVEEMMVTLRDNVAQQKRRSGE